MRASQTQDSYWRGILQRKTPRAQTDGFVQKALNFAFPGGTPVGRPGLRPFHGADFPANIKGMGWHVDEDGRKTLLVASGAEIYRCNEGGDPILLDLLNLPSTERIREEPEVVNFLSLSGGTNTTFIYDGVNQNLKYDGVHLTRMGIKTPGAPAIAINYDPVTTPFCATGKHLLLQTYFSGHHESSPTELNSARAVTLSSPKQFLIPSPTPDDPQVLTWRLYMTTAGGSVFYFVDEADIGVNLVVGISDTDLQGRVNAKPIEFFVNDPPPGPAVALTEHRGQLAGVFTDDTNLVRFSNLDPDFMVPEGWPADFVQPVSHGDGDKITALASMQEWLVVFKTTGTFGITGATFAEYLVEPVLAAAGGKRLGLGCINPRSILQIENGLFFASRAGIYRIDRYQSALRGISATLISEAIDDLYASTKFSLGAATFFDRVHHMFGFLGHG